MSFAERMRECRELRELTQGQLAYKSTVHLNSISYYERGFCEPTLSNAVKIAKALKVPLDYLAGLTDEK